MAPPGSVAGYGDRGVNGAAYRHAAGFTFTDTAGENWWVIFQPVARDAADNPPVRGDVLACRGAYGEPVQVRVLAGDVLRADADAAFRKTAPSSYEDAARIAAGVSEGIA
ncbi:hypothetical protein [Arthrobacter sp. Soil736]|uniref:hypothetical protein n=1 Tax=Arthrobacter sp. Soil736 TaxID=1736395 RepID=UPI000A8EFA27|nr:hypothetical protein [Arthrobacter sp. Soil736]